MKNKELLAYWFSDKEQIFNDFSDCTLDKNDRQRRRIFIDRKSNLLFVAHLDTIQKPVIHGKIYDRIYAAGLDDRLGCHIAYSLSEKLNADLLLTDNEELGKSTAQFHICKNYNWIAEFDRNGTDVVTYEMDNRKFLKELKKHFTIGIGSFSDITSLNTESCCVNIGIGYYDAHSQYSFFEPKIFQSQIVKFLKFHNENKNRKFKQDFEINDFSFIKNYSSGADEKLILAKSQCDICGYFYNYDELLETDKGVICENCITTVKF